MSDTASTSAQLKGLLHCLPSISLTLLEQRAPLLKRTDCKYITTPEVVEKTLSGLGEQFAALEINGLRSFDYRSMYFDSVDLESFWSSLHQHAGRFKVRTREYVDSGKCMLEIKTEGNRGQTLKTRLAHAVDRRDRLGPAGIQFVDSTLQRCGLGERLVPTLATHYHRSTLFDGATLSRITIDQHLEYSMPNQPRHALGPYVVIETKTIGMPTSYDRALWNLGIRPIAISKFATAMALEYPNLPGNRWNRVLRDYFEPEVNAQTLRR